MSSFKLVDENNGNGAARIAVFGVGGGGGNAVQHMILSNVSGVKFICANTDKQALDRIDTENKIQLGEQSTRGLGAGANPDVGRAAAEESLQDVRAQLENTDMVFITAGMGGGTGTGAAPVIAKIAKEMKILTVGVVTTPFKFEGKKRILSAEKGIEALEQNVDSLVVIPNQQLLKVYRNLSMAEAYKKVDDVLLSSVRNIFDLIIRPGYINLDFNDLKTAMGSRGYAMMGDGFGSGDGRARQAAEQAIRSPLLEGVTNLNAKSLVINITSGEDPDHAVTMDEVDEVMEIVNQIANLDDGNIFFGTAIDPEITDGVRVTVVATGLERNMPVEEPTRPTNMIVDETPAVARQTETTETVAAPVAEPAPAEQKKSLSIMDFLNSRPK